MKPLSEGVEEVTHGGLEGSQPESSAGPSSVSSSAHNTPGNISKYYWTELELFNFSDILTALPS